MLFMEHLKEDERLEHNQKRLGQLALFDNSYVRFPRSDVFSGALG